MTLGRQKKLVWPLTGAVAALVIVGGLSLWAVGAVGAMQLAGNEPEVASPVPTARGLPDRGVATLAGRWRGPGFGGKLDYPALLADALGVTVEELQTAQEAAHQAALEQALEEGLITQEQADRMLSLRAVRGYLNREALLAEALGMSVAELQAAY